MCYANAVSAGSILRPRLLCRACEHERAEHVTKPASDAGCCLFEACDCVVSPEDFAAFEEVGA